MIQTVIQSEKRDFINSNRRITELEKEYNNLEHELSVLGRKLAKGILSDELFKKLSEEVQKELDIVSEKLRK